MSRTTAALAVAALTMLTACGTQQAASPTASPAGASGVSPSSGSVCATASLAPSGDLYSAADGVRAPAGFVVTAVVECVVEARPVAGDGVWNFVVEKRATAKVGAFATALQRPDEPPTDGPCSAVGYVVTWFALVDASGRTVHAAIPADSCGQPQGDAMAAMQALTFVDVSVTRRDRVKTEAQTKAESAATAVGCATPFKDMIAITDGDHAAPRSAPDPILGSSSGVVTVCRFSAGKDTDGMPLLSFVSGEKLSAAASTAVVRELAASGPARPCRVAHTAVTGLFTEQDGWALVEVDGCHRVEGGDAGGWRQATPALLALLR